MEEEFEIVPVSPLRRLERRIERLEEQIKRESGSQFLKEIVDIIKVNQLIIDEVVKSNEALKLEISKLYPKLDSLVLQMQELLNFIKASAFQEAIGEEAFKPLVKKMNEMVELLKDVSLTNKQLVERLELLERRTREQKQPAQLPIRLPIQTQQPQQPQQGLVLLEKK
ncbi:MAG: hypothetical protein QXQ14_02020 [Candidatus Aenigmatarchaeota archaeon]